MGKLAGVKIGERRNRGREKGHGGGVRRRKMLFGMIQNDVKVCGQCRGMLVRVDTTRA